MPTAAQMPIQDFATLAEWGTEHLATIIAIDSQSDEDSQSIPSTEGQRRFSEHLQGFFGGLGYDGVTDEYANLFVRVPARPLDGVERPTLALMCHIDTSKGTAAVERLDLVPGWDGSPIAWSDNDRLEVSAARYEAVAPFLGEDVLHGPGSAPIGLDDKLGIAELMTLARVLSTNPHIAHGELRLVFRPDEEIGRMAAVVGLAEKLEAEGVTRGYTVDGIEPFEVNNENFNASRAIVKIPDTAIGLSEVGAARHLSVALQGAKSHGATAKAEGYLNATYTVARALTALGQRDDIVLTAFRSDALAETDAATDWLLTGADREALDLSEAALLDGLRAELEPHAWKGAGLQVTSRAAIALDEPETRGGAAAAMRHLQAFLASAGPEPKLSEHSDGFQGYSNPHFIMPSEGGYEVRYRLRDFDPAALRTREDEVRAVCAAATPPLEVVVEQQYINMGPRMTDYPELLTWALEAGKALGIEPTRRPIRGGTGVDPFLERGIPIANLGTGYFAPESEKELTSRQNIARHSLWLVMLVQTVG